MRIRSSVALALAVCVLAVAPDLTRAQGKRGHRGASHGRVKTVKIHPRGATTNRFPRGTHAFGNRGKGFTPRLYDIGARPIDWYYPNLTYLNPDTRPFPYGGRTRYRRGLDRGFDRGFDSYGYYYEPYGGYAASYYDGAVLEDAAAWNPGYDSGPVEGPLSSTVLTSGLGERSAVLPRSEADIDARLAKAVEIRQLGWAVDWQYYTYLQLVNMEIAIRKARDLKALGVDVDWRRHEYTELADWESRIKVAKDLERRGVQVDWRKHSFQALGEMRMRADLAAQLQARGNAVDWRRYSVAELTAMLADSKTKQ